MGECIQCLNCVLYFDEKNVFIKVVFYITKVKFNFFFFLNAIVIIFNFIFCKIANVNSPLSFFLIVLLTRMKEANNRIVLQYND